ncbi:MAG: SOS response-associated peptidase [Xanthomonadaceae bacterium]|nr:SOS response-associated peptidase [Xanthomonadaceae bacterium]
MCGRYTNRAADPPRYNIAPGTDCVVIRRNASGAPDSGLLRWGFAPHWLRDPGKAQINARAETVHEKPMFKTAFRNGRCLVPADGWYEWARDGDKRQPWFFSMADETPFAFAGLWTGNTFAIMTTAASTFAERIHARMPVLLRERDWDEWLDEHPQGPGRLQFLCRTWQSAPLAAWPVSPLVNRPQHDAPDCTEPTGDALTA